MWSQIYIVHLESNVHRLQYLKNQWWFQEGLGGVKPTLFDATWGILKESPQWFIDNKIIDANADFLCSTTFSKNHQLGVCGLCDSTVRLWNQIGCCKEKQWCLILDDDVIFEKENWNDLDHLFYVHQRLPKDADMYYLGFQTQARDWNSSYVKRVNSMWVEIVDFTCIRGTYAYAITPQGADFLLKTQVPFKRAIDALNWENFANHNFKVYAYLPIGSLIQNPSFVTDGDRCFWGLTHVDLTLPSQIRSQQENSSFEKQSLDPIEMALMEKCRQNLSKGNLNGCKELISYWCRSKSNYGLASLVGNGAAQLANTICHNDEAYFLFQTSFVSYYSNFYTASRNLALQACFHPLTTKEDLDQCRKNVYWAQKNVFDSKNHVPLSTNDIFQQHLKVLQQDMVMVMCLRDYRPLVSKSVKNDSTDNVDDFHADYVYFVEKVQEKESKNSKEEGNMVTRKEKFVELLHDGDSHYLHMSYSVLDYNWDWEECTNDFFTRVRQHFGSLMESFDTYFDILMHYYVWMNAINEQWQHTIFVHYQFNNCWFEDEYNKNVFLQKMKLVSQLQKEDVEWKCILFVSKKETSENLQLSLSESFSKEIQQSFKRPHFESKNVIGYLIQRSALMELVQLPSLFSHNIWNGVISDYCQKHLEHCYVCTIF